MPILEKRNFNDATTFSAIAVLPGLSNILLPVFENNLNSVQDMFTYSSSTFFKPVLKVPVDGTS